MKSFETQSSYFAEWPLHLGTFDVTGKPQAVTCPSQRITSGGTWWLCPLIGVINSDHGVKVVFSVHRQHNDIITVNDYFVGRHSEPAWLSSYASSPYEFQRSSSARRPSPEPAPNTKLINSDAFNSIVIPSGFSSWLSPGAISRHCHKSSSRRKGLFRFTAWGCRPSPTTKRSSFSDGCLVTSCWCPLFHRLWEQLYKSLHNEE